MQSLLNLGVAVAAVSYRLCTAEFNHAIWPEQLHDAASAVRWLRAHAATSHNLDPRRLGCFGYSAGAGLCTALALADDDAERVQLAVAVAGWSDFFVSERGPSSRSNTAESPSQLSVGLHGGAAPDLELTTPSSH